MKNLSTTFERLKDAIGYLTPNHGDGITLESNIEEFGMDSLDKVEAIMAIEEEFGFEIEQPDEEALAAFKSVHQLVEFIDRKLEKK